MTINELSEFCDIIVYDEDNPPTEEELFDGIKSVFEKFNSGYAVEDKIKHIDIDELANRIETQYYDYLKECASRSWYNPPYLRLTKSALPKYMEWVRKQEEILGNDKDKF